MGWDGGMMRAHARARASMPHEPTKGAWTERDRSDRTTRPLTRAKREQKKKQQTKHARRYLLPARRPIYHLPSYRTFSQQLASVPRHNSNFFFDPFVYTEERCHPQHASGLRRGGLVKSNHEIKTGADFMTIEGKARKNSGQRVPRSYHTPVPPGTKRAQAGRTLPLTFVDCFYLNTASPRGDSCFSRNCTG